VKSQTKMQTARMSCLELNRGTFILNLILKKLFIIRKKILKLLRFETRLK